MVPEKLVLKEAPELVLVPENSRQFGTREFSTFWVVLVSVLEKNGPGKKYRYLYVPEKIWGTVTLWFVCLWTVSYPLFSVTEE